jgi:hypothetical protein
MRIRKGLAPIAKGHGKMAKGHGRMAKEHGEIAKGHERMAKGAEGDRQKNSYPDDFTQVLVKNFFFHVCLPSDIFFQNRLKGNPLISSNNGPGKKLG